MSDETDTTSEVARVLIDHTRLTFDGKCSCGFHGRLGELFAAHQAAMLAEAGLLREEHSNELAWDRGYTWGHNDSQNETETANPYRVQIATQEPAERTQGGSGGCGASGGLGGRLRGLIPETYSDDGYFGVTAMEIREFADEADRLENEAEMQGHSARSWRVQAEHARAQVEAIHAAITREAAHGDAITRCNLVAERFQTVLDGEVAP